MHELTVATSLIELASDHARREGAGSIIRLSIRIGALQHIARSIAFCFEAAARGTPCEGAVLEIEEVPLTVQCDVCNDVKTPSGPYNFRCPDCGAATPRVVTGRELQFVSLTLAERQRAERHSEGIP
ncbi:MAG: hydrogenase maturation nickel metallochaperone HypA [Rhodospirillales bacterium]|nr:hydrogenase maturation nickel metallochaperone HypA [Rhodospirillales bacterium]